KVLNDSLQFRPMDVNQDLYKNWIYYYQNTGHIDSMKIYADKLDSINGLIFKSNSDAVNTVTTKLNTENKLLLRKSHKLNYWYVAGIVIILGIVYIWIYRNYIKEVKESIEPTEPELLIVKDARA